VEGIQAGNGTALYNNGNKYTGQYEDGLKQGYGLFEVCTSMEYSSVTDSLSPYPDPGFCEPASKHQFLITPKSIR
jgi:hypothetical protein